jgi:hypothetical protein
MIVCCDCFLGFLAAPHSIEHRLHTYIFPSSVLQEKALVSPQKKKRQKRKRKRERD